MECNTRIETSAKREEKDMDERTSNEQVHILIGGLITRLFVVLLHALLRHSGLKATAPTARP